MMGEEHDVQKMKAYKPDHVCLSVSLSFRQSVLMIQRENRWTDFE
jgi:hypothetical protein